MQIYLGLTDFKKFSFLFFHCFLHLWSSRLRHDQQWLQSKFKIEKKSSFLDLCHSKSSNLCKLNINLLVYLKSSLIPTSQTTGTQHYKHLLISETFLKFPFWIRICLLTISSEIVKRDCSWDLLPFSYMRWISRLVSLSCFPPPPRAIPRRRLALAFHLCQEDMKLNVSFISSLFLSDHSTLCPPLVHCHLIAEARTGKVLPSLSINVFLSRPCRFVWFFSGGTPELFWVFWHFFPPGCCTVDLCWILL